MNKRPAMFSAIGLALVLITLLNVSLTAQATPAEDWLDHPSIPTANSIRISQVYGGGGANTGSPTYKYDYVELFNAGLSAVDISGWSLQYGSATGYFASSAANLYAFTAGTIIQPGKYLLIQLSAPGTLGADLPIAPDFTTPNLTMSASNGKVALATVSTALGCGATASPCTLPDSRIVDLAAWGTANNAEGGVSINNGASLDNTKGGVRKLGGCQDTDINNDDFTVVVGAALIPRNSASAANFCSVPEADLSIAKTGPTITTPGETITYTISLSNTGVATATSSIITDNLPAEISFVTTTVTSGFAEISATQLRWDVGDVAPGGSVTIQVQGVVTSNVSSGVSFTNTATASTSAAETNLSNNTAQTAALVRLPDLAVNKTGPALVLQGDALTYTINISNTGYPGTSDLIVTDTLPAHMTYVTDTASVASVLAAPQVYVWTLPGLASGGTQSFDVAVHLSPSAPFGVLTNTVEVGSSTSEESSANNQAKWPTTVGGTDLVVVKQGPAQILPGATIVYTLSVANNGNLPATQVWLTDTLPAAVTYITDSLGGSNTQVGQAYGWSLGTLAAGGEISFTVTGTAASSGLYANDVFTNTAHVIGAEADGNPTNNLASLATLVIGADPFVLKQGPATVYGGELISYTIVYGNRGSLAADVILTDTLPLNFTLADIAYDDSGLPAVDGTATRSWTRTLAAGDRFTFTLGLIVPDSIAYGTRITNTIDIATNAAGNNPSDDRSSAGSTVLYPITPIGVVRAAGSWTGSLQGNVTVPPGVYRNNAFALQDATGGMYIYAGSSSIPALALGDVVQISGTLKNFSGLLEIDPTTAIVLHGPGTVPSPLITQTNAGTIDAAQGWLVQVTGAATWPTLPPVPGASDWSFYINDGSGQVQVFVDKDTKIDMRGYVSPTQATVIGFSGNFNGTPQIMPRYQSDIIVPDVIPPVVTATVPANNATGVSPYLPLNATFSESLNPTTITTATFTLADANGSISGALSYAIDTHTAAFTPDSSLAAFTRYTATLTTGIQDEAGNSLAAPYVWSFTVGALDTTPPTVVAHFPASEAISVPVNSRVVITFSEDLKPNTLIPANFTLTGPSGTIGWSTLAYDAVAHRVTLTPIMLTAQTRYTMTVNGVTDWASNPLAATEWSFTTASDIPMHAYHGDLHNHTSYSDGSLTAATAFATGRANGFDFMAVTDHSYAVDDGEWADMLTAANNATIDGVFVALRGVEYTQGAEGHINVINTVRHAVRTNTGCSFCDYTPNLEKGVTVDGFYNWLSITGTVGLNGEPIIAQFNHPGWINFNDWAYHPEVSPTMKLEEVGNGSGTSYVFSEDEYIRSLDYGWKLAATNNADTHSPYWGSNTPHRTGAWMPALSKADLLDALEARRTFATEDVNYALGMKANGAWMGSDIGNIGSLAFGITGFDPDAEGSVQVQLITFGGKVVTQTQFASSTFAWAPIVPVTPGEHYYYVKVTQADGDRIVSSPIWAHGDVDVSLTDLTIEPTIASIYNPSLITARVTNRMVTTQTVTVTFQIPGVADQIKNATIPGCVKGPCVDGYASISWQPTVTGPVTITAFLSGTPAGDNLEDNQRSTVMDVTDEHLPLILIDAAHNNINAGGREMRMFIKDLSDHRYNVLKQLTPFTAASLNTDTVKLLVITAFQTPYTAAELDAIANFVATGGSLWICNVADYNVKLPWANTAADRLNVLIAAIESRTGTQINMRMNDDEVIDGNTNNGYVFGVEPGDFPGQTATSIGVNVERISTWSLGSIRGRLVTQPITAGTPGVQIVVQGDMDAGYSSDSFRNPYHTNNTDSDSGGDAYIYNPTWVYPVAQPAGAIPLPLAAVTQLPNGGGRLMLYGDSNDGFGTFAYTAGDGKQNELFNLETVMWLLGDPVKKSTIAQARAYDVVNEPNNLRKLVWIEGKVTAAYGEFFNVLYVQDETGGITIHAPAGDISATQYLRGAQVRVLGTIDQYQGDTEVEFFEAEQVQVLTPTNHVDPAPLPLSTHAAALEANQGWLTQITGTVTVKAGESIFVDDGTGPVRVFLDGYNGTWGDIQVLDQVTIKGMVSEDGEGHRIRVRNHGMHPLIPDDVKILTPDLSGSHKLVNTTSVTAGDLLTYTLIVSNSGNGSATFALTDTLDANVTLINAPGFTVNGSMLTVTGTLNALASQTFAVVVQANAGYSGTLSNVAQLSGDGQTRPLTAPNVTVVLPPVLLPDFSGSGKTVNTAVITGSQPFTYTLVVSNSGAASGTFALTDTLNANLTLISAPGFTVNGSTLTAAGPLPALGSQTFVVEVRATATFSGTLANTAQLSGDGQTRPLSAPNVIHRPQYVVYLPVIKR